MTGEQLQKQMRIQPFKAFQLHLADGRTLKVDHPEFLLYVPGMRTCVVADLDGGGYDIVDLLLITSIRVSEGNGRGRRKKNR